MTEARHGAPIRPRWRRVLSHPLAHLAAALILVAAVQSLWIKVYQVPSASMEQTLIPGDRMLVDRLDRDAAPGDVVVFSRPDSWGERVADPGPLRVAVGWIGDLFGFGPSNDHAMVKRVVGAPGQTVTCCDSDGRVVRDGQPVDEPYVTSDLPFEPGALDCATTPASSRCFAPLTLPDDRYLLLGDNRAGSSDSISPCRGRELATSADCARLVPGDAVVGSPFFVFWPLDRWASDLSAHPGR